MLTAPAPARAFDTWVAQRDRQLVRQSLDFSCGLAALATVLSELGPPVSERALLDELFEGRDGGDPETPGRQSVDASPDLRGINFADLARLARRRGFRVQGVTAPVRLLPRLRAPVIVALRIEGQAHFSVLRAAAPDGAVWLADPSWGNRRLAAWEFRRYFERTDGRAGRLLLIAAPAPAEDSDPVRPGMAAPAASATAPVDEPTWRWPVHLPPGALGAAPES